MISLGDYFIPIMKYKKPRSVILRGLVERVGVEPTRYYYRGILSFPVDCLWSISGAMVLIKGHILGIQPCIVSMVSMVSTQYARELHVK